MSDARTHEPAPFEQWYAEVAESLVMAVASSVGDPVVAREATAEALARAFERWDKVGRMASPAGWVHATAVNLCRRSWRRRSIERRALEKAGRRRAMAEGDGAGESATEARLAVDPLVNDLPPRMQQAVRYRYWNGMSEREVAANMGISEGAASALLSQARRRLGDQLGDPVSPARRSR
ncbi:MAG: sigma-70 family RNA polymerase sigma factor [Actinomycetota bacterium]